MGAQEQVRFDEQTVTEQNELVTQDLSLALPDDEPWLIGLDNLDEQDILLPYIRLTQSITDEVAEGLWKPGELRHSITDELYEQPLLFVPVRVTPTRARFVDRTRVCFSVDGVTGQGDPGGACATCEYAQWGHGSNGERDTPPECDRGLQYVALLVGHEPLPVAIIFSRTSTPAARKLNYFAKAYKRGSVFGLHTVSEKGPKGTYFRLDVTRKRDLNPDEIKTLIELRQMIAGKRLVVEQEQVDANFDGDGTNIDDGKHAEDPW